MQNLFNLFLNSTSAGGSLLVATPAPIYSADFPANGAYALPAGFSKDNGWMLCKFVSTAVPTTSVSQFPFTIHSGNTTHTMGIRINGTLAAPYKNAIGTYFRTNSVVKGVERGKFGLMNNEIKTAIVVWRADGYQYLIVDDQFVESTQTDARATAFTTMQIGGRSAGSEPLVGEVLYAELGNQYLTPQQAISRLAQNRTPLVIATSGQSNIQNWADGEQTSASSGHDGFTGVLAPYGTYGCPGEVVQVHAAEGGSSVYKGTNATEYWLEDDLITPGPELTQFFTSCDRVGKDPDFILWDQGESECHSIDTVGSGFRPTSAQYKNGLIAIFNLMRARYPRAQIVFGMLGIRTTFANTGGIQRVAEIQQEIIHEYPWAHFGWERYDQALWTDGVHYTDAAYLATGQRAARRIQRLQGFDVPGGSFGPSLVSATRSGAVITATIQYDKGTDFTPTTGIEGFTFKDSTGATIAISSAVRASATTITITLATTPTNLPGTLYYIYDNAAPNLANIVRSNAANTLPLRRGKVAVA